MESWNLVLGLTGGVLWAGAFVAWYARATFSEISAGALAAAIAVVNVILIFGSLRLLGGLSDDLWNLVGTGGRAVFDVCAAIILIDARRTA